MKDITALHRLREERFFGSWDGDVDQRFVTASEAAVRRLIDDLLALGPELSEGEARLAVGKCVCRFNDMDEDGWICTIEREDIFEQIGRIVDSCGFEYDEDWLDERDW